MKRVRPFWFLLTLTVLACGRRPPEASAPNGATGLVVHTWAHARALEGNRLGDAADRSVHVYLPPSYFTHPERRYPTVYLLHGFGSTGGADVSWLVPSADVGGKPLDAAMDAGIAAGRLREMIVVMPDCTNAYGGSFYVNSSVTGAWEDFVVRDLVAFVDGRFRTTVGASSRALVGHSMGGFGALRIAFAHPDVFGVAYGLSSCCIDDMLVSSTRPEKIAAASMAKTADEVAGLSFFQRAVVAAGAAFTPSPGTGPLQVELPFVPGPSGILPVEPVQRTWAGMLATSSIARNRDSLARLRAIGLSVGDQEEIAAIARTTRAMDQALTAAGVTHDFVEFHGGHADRVGEQIETSILPFVSRHLGSSHDER